MVRSELVNALASRFPQLTPTDADLVVKEIIDVMSQTLVRGQRIEIRGFGSFALVYRAPRTGRNPKTGIEVVVRDKCVPHFRPGKELRNRTAASAVMC